MTLSFTSKDPELGYLNHQLLLPKKYLNEHAVKNALTFQLNQAEPVIDPETGEETGTRMREIHLWDETKHHISVPREFIAPEDLEKFRFPVVDERPVSFRHVDFNDNIRFRDDRQAAAYAAVKNNRGGTLNLGCGKGKTVLALKWAAECGVPTLVVVNTGALMDQWIKEIEKHLGIPRDAIGVIKESTCEWDGYSIVVSTVQTLARKTELRCPRFRSYFGLTIYDEAHHMSAPYFIRSADLTAGMRLSLTATPSRTDRMESLYQYHLGRVIYSDIEQDLIPNTEFYRLHWVLQQDVKDQMKDKTGVMCVPKVRVTLGTLDWRNKLILECLEKDLQDHRVILVLTHSVEHAKLLHQLSPWPDAGLVIGEIKEGRIDILEKSNPVFGTFQLAREGLDKPELDTLYITTPFANSNDQQQAWGRIQRTAVGKNPPLVRVFEDMPINCCKTSNQRIRKFLKAAGYPYKLTKVEVS